MKRMMFALAGLLALGGAALAAGDDIVGDWQRTDGLSRIRMAPCGDGICGHVTWLKNPNSPAKVGQRVFYGLKPSGAGWAGEAFNPEDGKTYSGKVSLTGSHMTTSGCVFGGLICKSVTWSRLN
ncbi:DUF2147 domain-containing protein [Rhodoblastus sp.]|uniref:DUF2147 domain-containing protein n=1 Tax=Rhodoblastus sp. TaxID=1962975 RepID=UPI0035B4ACD3